MIYIVSQKVVQYINDTVICVMTCSELCFSRFSVRQEGTATILN